MTGRSYGFGLGSRSSRRHGRRGGGGSTPPALPAIAAIVGHFNASDIPPQADNSNLVQWNDSSASGAHAAQATGSKQPKYRAAGGAGVNGKAYVTFDGVDDVLGIATPGALKTAIDGLDYTIMVVVDNVASGGGGFGCVFGTGVGGDSLHVMATPTAVGNSGAKLAQMTVSGSGYRSFGVGSSDTNGFGGSGGGNLRRYFFRGCAYSSYAEAGKATGGKTLAIGGGNVDATATFFFKGNIYRIVIWSKLLSPAEAMQAEIHFNWFYGQTHPAVTAGKFLHIDGDSRYVGVGADSGTLGWNVAGTAAYKAATGLGFPAGCYSNYAVGGLTIQKCIDKGGEIDAAAAALKAAYPAVAHRLMFEEFFNSRTLSVGSIATTGTLAYQTKQYVDARRSGMPAGTLIVGASPCDHADVNMPAASGWGNWLSPNGNPGGSGTNHWASLGFDGFAHIWEDATLGGDGANPGGDGIHLNEANQTVQANVLIAAYSAIGGF